MNLFSKSYCNGNTLPHNWNLRCSYVIILVQCNSFINFQNIAIPVKNSLNLYTTWLIYICTTSVEIIILSHLEFPFKKVRRKKNRWEILCPSTASQLLRLLPHGICKQPPGWRTFNLESRRFCPCDRYTLHTCKLWHAEHGKGKKISASRGKKRGGGEEMPQAINIGCI